MENSLLYPLHLYFRYTKINLILIVLTSSALLFFFQYLSSSSYKIVNFKTFENPKIMYEFSQEDIILIDEINGSYTNYEKEIENLFSEKIQSKALDSLNFDKDINLELLNQTFDNVIDRETYKVYDKIEYIKTFRTYLSDPEARLFIKSLTEIASDEVKNNNESLINIKISSLQNKIKLKEMEIKRNFNQKLAILEINSNFADDLFKINVERSIGVLKNNLIIANKLNLVEIQRNSYEQTVLTEPSSVFETVSPKNWNAENFDKKKNSNNVASITEGYINSFENKLTNTFNKFDQMILVNSLNNPIFLLGSKLLEEEIKILSQGDYKSLNDDRASNILLKQRLEDNLNNSLKNDELIINAKIEIEILKNLNSRINEMDFNYVSYNPSSIEYQSSLPSTIILIFFSLFIGILISILYRIFIEAYNYKSNN